MRLQPFVVFGHHEPSLDDIVLTTAERGTLRRAAAILDQVREMRNARVPTDWYAGDDDDADLVFGWRIAAELARTGRIGAEAVSDP